LFPPKEQESSPPGAGGLGDGSPPAGSRGRALGEGLGAKPQKRNNTRDINANFKWKCNTVMVKSTRKLSSIEEQGKTDSIDP